MLNGPALPLHPPAHPPLHLAEAEQGTRLLHQAGTHSRLVHRGHHVLVEVAVGAALAAVGPLRAQGAMGDRCTPTPAHAPPWGGGELPQPHAQAPALPTCPRA